VTLHGSVVPASDDDDDDDNMNHGRCIRTISGMIVGGVKPKYSEISLSQCCFVHYRFHKDCLWN
jgi:hypothetical protein